MSRIESGGVVKFLRSHTAGCVPTEGRMGIGIDTVFVLELTPLSLSATVLLRPVCVTLQMVPVEGW